ncbi:MAG: alpha/beta hydrolase-fold protein [Specibacter sp.]
MATGPIPALAMGLGALALAFLLVRRSPKWWIFCVLSGLASAAAASAGGWAIIHVWYWWPEDLPNNVLLCVGFGLWGLILGLTTAVLALAGALGRRRGSHRDTGRPRHKTSAVRGLLGVAAAIVVVAVSALQVNAYFGEYPTVGSLVKGTPAVAQGVPHFTAKPGVDRFRVVALRDGWKAPASLPAVGEFRLADIPGTTSGFHARAAIVYLPPAYFVSSAPLLPVVVLVTGQPGAPGNFLQSGGLQQTLANYADAHHGLAPVVVMPDANGSEGANTMCMNSELGNVDTYMAHDVPRWITNNLNIDTNHAHWAVAGFSYGATCAVQMVTRHPNVYRSFAAISPEREPALTANRAVTVERAFHGDVADFNAVVPMTLLKDKRYPEIHGWFASGQQDAVYTANVAVLEAAGRKAGMTLTSTTFPGGHSWVMVTEALPAAFSFLGARLGLQ